jgi:5-methylcytosine-specific restriction endonuclease McrA
MAIVEKERKVNDKEYRLINKERLAERKKVWNSMNSEKIAAQRYRWQKANPDRIAAYHHNRRALALGNGGTHTFSDIQTQYNRQMGKCFYCGKKVGNSYHVDHIVPLSKGGSNGPENIAIACPTCNMRKNAKMPEEFMEQISKEVKGCGVREVRESNPTRGNKNRVPAVRKADGPTAPAVHRDCAGLPQLSLCV